MKHIAQITKEFAKVAVWRDKSNQYQKDYLRKHPKSKYKITTPVSSSFEEKFAQVIDIRPEFYDKKTKTFSFELSDLDLGAVSRLIILRNPKTNNQMRFTRFKVDQDGTGEDTYGWWYKSDDYQYKLLVIND